MVLYLVISVNSLDGNNNPWDSGEKFPYDQTGVYLHGIFSAKELAEKHRNSISRGSFPEYIKYKIIESPDVDENIDIQLGYVRKYKIKDVGFNKNEFN